MLILYNTTDISNKIKPIIVVAIEISVYGIEKYLVSLKVIKTKMAKTIPVIINMIPGIHKYLSGCFIAINSINDPKTSPVCGIAAFVDVLLPVL